MIRCSWTRLGFAGGLCVLAVTATAWAINPASWTHTTEADFDAGKTDNTVVTNLGDVKLAAHTKLLGKAPGVSTIFSDIQAIGDTVYIAAGPKGVLLQKQGDKLTSVATLDGEQIFTLDVYHGKLLVGISGEPSRLAVLDHGKLKTLVTFASAEEKKKEKAGEANAGESADTSKTVGKKSDKSDVNDAASDDSDHASEDKDSHDGSSSNQSGPSSSKTPPQDRLNDAHSDAAGGDDHAKDQDNDNANGEENENQIRYIWDMLIDGDAIYIATGTQGKVYRVEPGQFDAKADKNPGLREVLDTSQTNVLCLGRDARGHLYCGTDTDGLVYRLTPDGDGGYAPFVLYDADEPEIGALLVEKDGTVYAGTADADQAKPGRLEKAQSKETGRPAAPPTVSVPAKGEEQPAPPGVLPHVPPRPHPIGQPKEGEAQGHKPAKPDLSKSASKHNPAKRDLSESASEGPDSAAAANTKPTEKQYDKLRQVIQARLEAARETGELQAGTLRMRSRQVTPAGTTRARPVTPHTPAKQGNAVYRIDPQGFVSEVFRESVMILKLVERNGKLLVATGNQGQVFRVDPQAQETTTLVDLEAQQVPAMTVTPDGGILLATANPARLLRLSETVAKRGTYTSQVMDAGQISLWGGLNFTGDIPKGGSVLIQTRSGNVGDPEQAPWSKWSDPKTLKRDADLPPLQPRQVKVTSPPARFLQYRLTLTSESHRSPIVNQIKVTYVTPNMKPRITSIKASYADTDKNAPPATKLKIEWEASDANEDDLTYRLDYQRSGSKTWIEIKKDLDDTSYEWETRQAPDGRYLIRVTASDRADNPGEMAKTSSRISDPVLVDNTPPTLKGLQAQVNGQTVKITATATDRLSPVGRIGYAVDSGDEFKPILPDDLIFDSTTEAWHVTISDLSAGPHVVTLRVRDARGNTTYRPVSVNIGK